MPVTIKDVAALAGVSPSTVSRTCKDHPSISRQTKEKVRRAMAQLGYEPNFRQATWPHKIHAPSVSSFRFPSRKLTRTHFIWKQSAASASSAIRSNILIQLLQEKMKKKFLMESGPWREAARQKVLLSFTPENTIRSSNTSAKKDFSMS